MHTDQHTSSEQHTPEFDVWTAPGTPVSIAYERGYAEGLEFAVCEITRLRRELERLQQQSCPA